MGINQGKNSIDKKSHDIIKNMSNYQKIILGNSTRGFTLIELLVVIAIIGILSSVVLASLNSARLKSNDARRKSDFHQMSIALEMYYNNNGGYPATGTTPSIDVSHYANTNPMHDTGLNSWNNLFIPLVNDGSMSFVPRDPVNAYTGAYPWSSGTKWPVGESVNRLYHYRSDGTSGSYDAQHYLLCCWLENHSDSMTLGYGDMLDPFDNTKYLHADQGYSIYNYCIGK